MKKFYINVSLLVFLLTFLIHIIAQGQNRGSFKVVPLGVKGGLDESNLSAYMVSAASDTSFVCLDAGTLRYGIEKAIAHRVFKVPADTVLRKYIKGYLISHAHLDHISGLILNSPDDAGKRIYAMPYVIDVLKDKYFTWKSWANFTNEGDQPALNKYHYSYLAEGREITIDNTSLSVKAFSLSHSNPYLSTAFLLRSNKDYLLYVGDTGEDDIEKSDKLYKLWLNIAPLITNHSLKAIFIEVSFPDEQPDKLLFGHLTPRWLMKEIGILSKLSGTENVRDLPIVITHIKPSGNNEQKIKRELKMANHFNLTLIYPVQGRMMRF